MSNTQFKTWWVNYWLAPFSWSRWADIETFNFGSTPYLLQGKVNSRSNAKKFRVTPIKNRAGVASGGTPKLSYLAEHGLIDEQVKFN